MSASTETAGALLLVMLVLVTAGRASAQRLSQHDIAQGTPSGGVHRHRTPGTGSADGTEEPRSSARAREGARQPSQPIAECDAWTASTGAHRELGASREPDIAIAHDGASWRGALVRNDGRGARIRLAEGFVCELPPSRLRWAGPASEAPAFRRVQIRVSGAPGMRVRASGIEVCATTPCDDPFLMAGRRLHLEIASDGGGPVARGAFDVGEALDLRLDHVSRESSRLTGAVLAIAGSLAAVIGFAFMAIGYAEPALSPEAGWPLIAGGLTVALAIGLPLRVWQDEYSLR